MNCLVSFGQEDLSSRWIPCGQIDQPINTRLLLPSNRQTSSIIQQGNFNVTSIDIPESAIPAIEEAILIWDSQINTTVPIKIKLQWTDTGSSTLAKTKPSSYLKNFSHQTPAVVWYPIALAEKIAGKELNNAQDYEIEIVINKMGNWYYGLDQLPADDQYDLLSILLHEIAHGLGFLSDAKDTGGGISFSSDDSFSCFDHLLIDQYGQRLVRLDDHSSLNEKAFVYTPNANNTDYQEVFTSETFLNSISLSHFHESSNSLMIPFIETGWSQHIIDEGTLATLDEIGWSTSNSAIITVYPNPTTEQISIKIPSSLDDVKVELYNLDGQLILSDYLQYPTQNILLYPAPSRSGIYILILQSNKMAFIQREKIIVLN
ncbi:MAG: T9SS type A sorting domain-containing protein [Reichenbachiella sp.]